MVIAWCRNKLYPSDKKTTIAKKPLAAVVGLPRPTHQLARDDEPMVSLRDCLALASVAGVLDVANYGDLETDLAGRVRVRAATYRARPARVP